MLAAVHPALQSAVLLCIDDNEDVLECEKSFLESFGYSVLTAASYGSTSQPSCERITAEGPFMKNVLIAGLNLSGCPR